MHTNHWIKDWRSNFIDFIQHVELIRDCVFTGTLLVITVGALDGVGLRCYGCRYYVTLDVMGVGVVGLDVMGVGIM